jgi:hypothetical protein
MSEYKTVALLKPGHELHEFFPNGEVPILGVVPHRVEGIPIECFLLDGAKLTESQISGLSDALVDSLPELYPSVEVASRLVLKGFPLRISCFHATFTNDPVVIWMASFDSESEDLSINMDDVEEWRTL